MPADYRKPRLVSLAFDFESSRIEGAQACMTLSRKDVLGIVQSAFDELGIEGDDLLAAKRAVLEEVAEGRLALALRMAIVAAGKAR